MTDLERGRVKTLIVHADVASRLALCEVVRGLGGVDAIEAAFADQARGALSRHAIALAFVDLRLGGDTQRNAGLALAREVRVMHPSVALVVTGVDDLAQVREATRLGASACISDDDLTADTILPVLRPFCDAAAAAQDGTRALRDLARAVLALPAGDRLALAERALVNEAMCRAGGNKTAAARLLGVHRKVVERRLGASLRERVARGEEMASPHGDH